MRRKMVVTAAAGALLLAGGNAPVQAQDGTQNRTQVQNQEQVQIYGSQLMTPEERAAYRERLRLAATPEERERIRREHHEQMRQRAAEWGATLPNEPPEQPGGAMRQNGMGRGGGMGPGGGRGGM
nr:hypothetical protein [Desulfobacteraceae bacterium]